MQLFLDAKKITGIVKVVDKVNDTFRKMYNGFPTSLTCTIFRKLVSTYAYIIKILYFRKSYIPVFQRTNIEQ